jgi:nucleotide-binding universal stress UspA family protein
MFRTVLLAVDLQHEESWRRALPEAAKIARDNGGTLHLVAVVPDFGMSMVGGYFPESFERDALRRAEAELEDWAAANRPEGLEPAVHLGHGDVAAEILRVAHAVAADLVVVAAHKGRTARDYLVGSNAHRVVRDGELSVLVVRG